MNKKLVINRCSRHDCYAIAIEDENSGTRVTSSKCCGSWSTVKEFSMSSSDWLELGALAFTAGGHTTFQTQVSSWMQQCFTPEVCQNMTERGDRFLEEAIELLQANGYDRARIPVIADYVYGRPPGEPRQETGGVMVTLAAYCNAVGVDMERCGRDELARIQQPDVMAKIQAKQASKAALPFDTPLPSLPAIQFFSIETAPTDNKVPLILARIIDGEICEMDFDAVYEKESESWEMPQEYWIWKSAFGRVEEPTHWAYQIFTVQEHKP
jgi:hypothetical protein